MKHLLAGLFAVGLLFCCGCQSSDSGEKYEDLVLNGGSRYQIVYPDRSRNPGTTALLKKSAELLSRGFKETLGVEFPVVRESRRHRGVKNIFLGNTRVLKAKGARPLSYKDFEFRIWEYKGDLYLAGSDRHAFNSSKVYSGHKSYVMGTTAAVICFMERFLDTRFLYPGMTGIDFGAPKKEIRIPGRFRYKGKPNLSYAPGRNYDFFYDYANSNYGPGNLRSLGGHSYCAAVPAAKYGKSNPEYFALLGTGVGKRRNSAGNHLCISNKKVQELIFKQVLRSLDEGAEVAELAQTDGFQPCLCDGCARYGNTADHGEKLWILHRKIAEEVLKTRPGKKVLIISYGPTAAPPKSFSKFPENVMVELCDCSPEAFAAWNKVTVPQGFMACIYNWGWYNMPGLTPKRTPEYAAAQARFFIKNKVRGIYRCGFGENFGLEGPVYYVFGKILEDPSRSEAKLLDEFYTRAFKEAAAPMKIFYTQLYSRLKLYSILGGAGFEGRAKIQRVLPRNPRILLGMIYTPELLGIMEKQLIRAEGIAGDPKVKKRLQLVRKEFDYTRTLMQILYFYNAFRISPDREKLNVLLNAVEGRNRMIDSYYDARGNIKPIPGWKELPLFGGISKNIMKTNGRLRASIEAPLTWNVKLLREKKIVPGASKSRMQVRKAQGKVAFGDFDKGAWSRAESPSENSSL